jgi:hypothetical protein
MSKDTELKSYYVPYRASKRNVPGLFYACADVTFHHSPPTMADIKSVREDLEKSDNFEWVHIEGFYEITGNTRAGEQHESKNS